MEEQRSSSRPFVDDAFLERLSAFASDSVQHPARRSEADGVLRIHEQRIKDLDARLALNEPEMVPLGVLMLVPEGTNGA